MKYGIGLDVGISSVGWAVLALDGNERPCGIIDMNSRIFPAAEHPKTGASLAVPRREARSARRRCRRRRHRNERIRYSIASFGLLTPEDLAELYSDRPEDIYELRVKALDEKLTDKQFAKVLIHLSQRRGFKSNRKHPSKDEDGKLLTAVNENFNRMKENGYRTAGEMFFKDETFKEHKRNKSGNYLTTISRDMVESEAHQIFEAQRKFNNFKASKEFEDEYCNILLSQRSFDEGPGGDSIYGGNQIEKMIGNCIFFPEEKRAAKATYSFEYFTLLEKVNHLRIIEDKESATLTPEQRASILELAHSKKELTYSAIRKALSLAPEQRFGNLSYANGDTEAVEKKEKFACLKAYHQIKSAFEKVEKGRFAELTREQLNSIGYALSVFKTSEKILDYLKDQNFTEEDFEAIDTIGNFSKFGHISVKACDLIIPYLEQGMVYSDACKAAGINFKGHDGNTKERYLHPAEEDYNNMTTSPVVKRAVSQAVKVINAIIRKQNESPVFINIELAREMSKDFTERNQLKKEMDKNKFANEAVIAEIKSICGNTRPSGLDIVKYKLYVEQDGRCAYSLKSIPIQMLFTDAVEVDHIVPYSISFDDSYKNKVLVFAPENRNKGNRLPMQYLNGQKKDNFTVWVKSSIRNAKKRDLLLKENIEDTEGFKERHLQDTKSIAVALLNYIQDNLLFAESSTGKKKRVTAVNGSVTSYIRKRWGISKIREDGDLHHAVDAVVIGCTTDAMIQQVSRYAIFRECQYIQGEDFASAVDPVTGEIVREFPYPWFGFRKELEARTANNPASFREVFENLPLYKEGIIDIPEKPIFVSRMPNHKVTGAAHLETIMSPRELEHGFAIKKVSLKSLKLKDGEIENYYNPGSDRLLYEALKHRLIQFDGKAEQAFAEDFHKPKADGSPGPVVRAVKICEKTTLNTSIHDGKGVASNDSMVRIDMFYVENEGYYFVPIYVSDTVKPTLPNKACVGGKPYSQWKEMNENDFIFSIYRNDLIKITGNKQISFKAALNGGSIPKEYESKEELAYFNAADISTASLTIYTHDGSYMRRGLGIKTIYKIEKYTVDVLGEYRKVNNEKRMPFR